MLIVSLTALNASAWEDQAKRHDKNMICIRIFRAIHKWVSIFPLIAIPFRAALIFVQEDWIEKENSIDEGAIEKKSKDEHLIRPENKPGDFHLKHYYKMCILWTNKTETEFRINLGRAEKKCGWTKI